MFELQPVLKGKLIELRPLKEEDYTPLFNAASDPLIWEQHPEKNRYEEKVFKQFFRGAMESGGAFAVVDIKSRKIIGSSRYYGYDELKSEIEIGWTFLARNYWGGAYNREMKDLMLKHAFRFVKNVIFIIGPDNFRSQKAVEKLGANLIGVRTIRGRESLVYQITSDEYLAE
jgi:RimJ/RimL family protein N-acetyltransferase